MQTSTVFLRVTMLTLLVSAFVGVPAGVAEENQVRGETAAESMARLLSQVEPRIKAIYETDEFRVRSFDATWLPDSSGYLKLETPEGESGPAINYAEGLRGDLLIITGSGETNTHIEITEGLVDRLIELGKRFDYFVYPNRDHGLSEGKGTTVHVQILITRDLIKHLPPGPR